MLIGTLVAFALLILILGIRLNITMDRVESLESSREYASGHIQAIEDKLWWVIFPKGDMAPHIMLAEKTDVRGVMEPLYALLARLGYKWETRDSTADNTYPRLVKVKK